MADIKYLDEDGLLYVKQKLDTRFVAKETGKGLSTNDFTDELKQTYDDTVDTVAGLVETGGEPNVIETVKVNNTALTPDANKAVNITVPTKTSDLTNDDNVVKDENYVHTDNNYTTNEKTKLGNIEAGADVNVIETVKVNNTALTPDGNKAVNVTVPTKVSDLTNDGDGTSGSHFATEAYVDTNGGKIDKIKVNNVEQTITSKTVNITVPTKTSDLTNDDNVVKDASYVHTDNNYTSTEKTKLGNIETGAEVNIIEDIKVNGTSVPVVAQDRSVSITIPTNNNQLTNGAGYQTSSDVQTAINAKISSTYKAKGSIAFASLPALSSSNEGNVYNITDAFTTTADFVEGAGKTHPAGTNVVIINTTGSTYKYDVLAGMVDLSSYVQNSDLVAITNSEIDDIFSDNNNGAPNVPDIGDITPNP